MPLQKCELDGKPGWRWGSAPSAKCYTYTPGDEASEREARRKALAQAVAMGEIETRQGQGNITTPDAGDLNVEARRYCASRGWAMSDGSYPIRPLDMHGQADLQKATRAVGRGGGSHEAIRRHIIKRARALGLSDMIPENWSSGGQSERMATSFEVEHRSATLQDVDKKLRLIDVIAVPWDQEAEVLWRGDIWRESHDRHAFDGVESHAGRVLVNREHKKGDTVGKVVQLDPSHQAGLFARAKIAETDRGNETLTLAEEGMIFPSVGFRVHGFNDMRIDRRSKTRRILRAFLDHLSMVEDPAYVGAEVLAVRAGSSGLAVVEQRPLLETPALDEAMNDDVLAWAASRLNR